MCDVLSCELSLPAFYLPVVYVLYCLRSVASRGALEAFSKPPAPTLLQNKVVLKGQNPGVSNVYVWGRSDARTRMECGLCESPGFRTQGNNTFFAGTDGSNPARHDVQDVLGGRRLRTLQKNMFLSRKIAQTVENQRFATDLMPPGGRGAATSGG